MKKGSVREWTIFSNEAGTSPAAPYDVQAAMRQYDSAPGFVLWAGHLAIYNSRSLSNVLAKGVVLSKERGGQQLKIWQWRSTGSKKGHFEFVGHVQETSNIEEHGRQ